MHSENKHHDRHIHINSLNCKPHSSFSKCEPFQSANIQKSTMPGKEKITCIAVGDNIGGKTWVLPIVALWELELNKDLGHGSDTVKHHSG